MGFGSLSAAHDNNKDRLLKMRNLEPIQRGLRPWKAALQKIGEIILWLRQNRLIAGRGVTLIETGDGIVTIRPHPARAVRRAPPKNSRRLPCAIARQHPRFVYSERVRKACKTTTKRRIPSTLRIGNGRCHQRRTKWQNQHLFPRTFGGQRNASVKSYP